MIHVKADAIVPDKENLLTILGRYAHGDYGMIADAGEFDGISKQIPEHLPYQATVTVDVGKRRHVKSNLPAGNFVLQARDHLMDHFIKIGVLERQTLRSETCKAQKVVNQALHANHVFMDSTQVVKAACRKLLSVVFVQNLRQAGNMAQWCANVMGNGVTKGFERFVSLFQLCNAAT